MPTVTANDRTFFYHQAGKGFPVLMGHSLCLDWEMFRSQVDALQDAYRVVALDFRGHGQSEPVTEPFTLDDYAADVFAVADALGIETFHWVGLSQGGMAGMRMALTHPERLASMTLLDTSADVEDPAKVQQYTMFAEQYRKQAPDDNFAKMLLRMTFFTPAYFDAHPEVEADYIEKLKRNDTESIYQATMAVISRKSIVEAIGAIQLPTLILVGEKDTATTPDKSQQIHDRIAGSELEIIPEAAHISTLENPAAVNEALRPFLDRHTP